MDFVFVAKQFAAQMYPNGPQDLRDDCEATYHAGLIAGVAFAQQIGDDDLTEALIELKKARVALANLTRAVS